MELIHNLGIDWKLFIAQILNFVILFFIIYKFLVVPLNNILEKRKLKIEEAYKYRQEAIRLIEKIRKLKKNILIKIKKEREEILNSAYQQREVLINNFLKETEKFRTEFEKKFEKEKEAIKKNFYLELNKEIPEIMEKLAFKVFHNKKLNREFIKKMLNERK